VLSYLSPSLPRFCLSILLSLDSLSHCLVYSIFVFHFIIYISLSVCPLFSLFPLSLSYLIHSPRPLKKFFYSTSLQIFVGEASCILYYKTSIRKTTATGKGRIV